VSVSEREARKFDPARAPLLDSAERDAYLPDSVVVDLLELSGNETVLDYGAGTGRLALAAAERLLSGRVIAVDEVPEMIERLASRVAAASNVEVVAIRDNVVPLAAASVDRILAINILHEVRGETALAEMHRLLAPDGLLLVIDWDRERPGEPGPPAQLRYTRAEAADECAAVGLAVEPAVHAGLPYHFVLRVRKPAS
jgi:ubiquinone/menaquinone biosynthesis C-methylase UbiE